MIKLNLKTDTSEHGVLKAYLEENASPILADKIQNGVKIVKDGKTLINKKDLTSFMKYACDEARKLAGKGATGACVKDDIVFGWLIHYFEEDSIEGSLFNEDGTPYKNVKFTPNNTTQHVPTPVVPVKPKPQISLFDFMSDSTEEKPTEEPIEEEPVEENVDDEPMEEPAFDVDMETGEILPPKYTPKGSSLYQSYMKYANANPNAVVVYRLGDFFEIYGQYAIDIGNKLELTITSRDCGLEERVPMIGFPYHCSDTYIRKMRKYYNVFLVDGEDTQFLPYEPENVPIFDNYDEDEEEPVEENNDDFTDLKEKSKAFDKEALMTFLEIFGDEIAIPQEDI